MNQFSDVEKLTINTIRILSAEGVQKANSGHPGMPMGNAPVAFFLYSKIMNYNPTNPKWLNRDRFVLSAGHGSMLLYSCLHLFGFDLSLDQLKSFRQWESKTPGHPEYGLTDGVETTTGPLGQGFSNAIGMAIAQAYLANMFNKENFKIIDHFIYGICSDGDLMEGISHECAAIAGHLQLGKVIFFYDNNGITIDGKTSLAFTEDVQKRFDAYGWHTEVVTDANSLEQLEKAVYNAQKDKRPSLILTKTNIGYGSPNKQDTSSVHGSPLGEEELKLTKKNLGWNYEESFYIPEEVKEYLNKKKKELQNSELEWKKLFDEYKKHYPDEAEKLLKYINGDFGNEWINKLPIFIDDGKKMATRQAWGKILNAIESDLPTMIGGSADLAPSVNCTLTGKGDFSKDNYSGKNFHFGIREHGMAGILNGMALYGGVIPFGATFLVFADYLRPSIRIAAMSKIKPILVFTHDSIGLGEDEPTHQPIEQLASLRTIPKLIVFRPADANETTAAWGFAIQHQNSPVALVLTRQGVPVLDQTKYPSANNLKKGAYILIDSVGNPDLILMASGSEVHLAVGSAKQLKEKGINVRVVSFPSWELFEMQSKEYKELVLPKAVKNRIAIEAGVAMGWEKYVGEKGKILAIDKYGASAPDTVLFQKFGFSIENVIFLADSFLNEF